jgi:parallel beta-helix repeat protein
LSDWAENNNFNNCTFDHTGTTDVGVKIPTGITKVQENNFIGCWFEGHTSSGTSYPLQLEGGVDNRFDKCRFAIITTQSIIKASGFASRYVQITDPYMDSGASFKGLPQGVTVTSTGHNRTANVILFGAKGDGSTSDTVAFQRAIDSLGATGGVVTGPMATYMLTRTSQIAHDSLTSGYCLIVNPSTDATTPHGPITFEFPRGTVFKLANSQAANSVMVLVDGRSAERRTAPTVFRGIHFDGNYATQTQWVDHGLITTLYCEDILIESCEISNFSLAGIQIMRDTRGAIIRNCMFDAQHALAESTGMAARIEVQDCTIEGCRFVTHSTAGRPLISFGCNADIDAQGRGMRVLNNLFAGGHNGYLVDVAGVTHCVIKNNVFRDCCDLNGGALQITLYTNQNGTYWESAHNVIEGNVFFNVRKGINLSGSGTGQLNGANFSSGAHSNIIRSNIITRDYDTLRTQLPSGPDTYPDRFSPCADGAAAVNMTTGIDEQGQDFTSGTATSATSTTLVNSGASMGTTQYVKYMLVITGGTGKGQVREIASHTATTFTVAAWDITPDTTSTYRVTNLVGGNEFIGNIIQATNTATVAIRSTAWIPSTFANNRVYGTTAANSFLFGTAANSPNAIYTGNKGYANNLGIASPQIHSVYRDEASGTAAVLTGTTSIAVTHGLGRTPTFDQIMVWPISDNGSATTWWVSAVTSTTFTISVDVNPAGTFSFAWRAFGTM